MRSVLLATLVVSSSAFADGDYYYGQAPEISTSKLLKEMEMVKLITKCADPAETEKQVPMVDEITRRAKRELNLSDAAAEALNQNFPRTVNEGSHRLEVGTDSGLAGELVRLLKGQDVKSEWSAVVVGAPRFENTYDKIAGVLQSPKDGPQLVTCVNIGRASSGLRFDELKCELLGHDSRKHADLDDALRVYRDHGHDYMNDMLITDNYHSKMNFKMIKKGPRAYACYISNDQM